MNTSLAFVPSFLEQTRRFAQGSRLAHRILLHPDELYRVPPSYSQVRTVCGIAYISQDGQDWIVPPGEAHRFAGTKDVALVSPLRGEALVIELFE
jgi:hypothetical protein